MEERRIEEGVQQNAIKKEPESLIYDISGLKLAFWGLLFTAIDVRIQGFDIMPNVIGYIIVIVGLGKIEAYEDKFSSAKKMAVVLAVLSLLNIYQAPAQNTPNPVVFSAGVFGAVPWLVGLFMIVGMVANIYFAYFMCMGMKSLLMRVGDSTLAGICDDRWKLILASEIGLMVSVLTVLLGVPFGAAITVIFGILSLIALVLFLLLIHHTYQRLDGKEGI